MNAPVRHARNANLSFLGNFFYMEFCRTSHLCTSLYSFAYYSSRLPGSNFPPRSMGAFVGKQAREPVDLSGPKAEFVKETINKDKVVIFSKSCCPYCVMAKEQFKKLSQSFLAIELDKRDDGDEIQDILLEMTGARTVPRVFIEGMCVGGGTDVKKMYETGELKNALQ